MSRMPALADCKPMQALDRLGPGAEASWSPDEARAYVDRFTRGSTENFSVLSALVPAALRPDFAAVYAFCRWADDLADEPLAEDTAAPEDRRARALTLLAWWRSGLDGIATGEAGHPVFVALGETVRRHALPLGPFHRLIDAFERDQRQTRYQTWDDLLTYCRDSADPVGELVLMLGGVRPPQEDPSSGRAFELSGLACSALQLTNFWQDVRRDLVERDRVYLPSAETGLTAEDLRARLDRPLGHEFRAMYIREVRGLVERTRAMYDAARELPGLCPPEIARVVWLLVEGGRCTLERVDRTGCATLWQRPKLGKIAKATILARARIKRCGSGAGSSLGGSGASDRPAEVSP